MGISYDPNEAPDVSMELLRFAKETGQHVVTVICDEEGAQIGDVQGMQFSTVTPFLPRPGECIRLQDGNWFVVQSVCFSATNVDDNSCLIPTVYAIERPKSGK